MHEADKKILDFVKKWIGAVILWILVYYFIVSGKSCHAYIFKTNREPCYTNAIVLATLITILSILAWKNFFKKMIEKDK